MPDERRGPEPAAALPRPASSPLGSVGQVGRYLAQSLRLMVGVPDYGTYCRHMAANHPGAPVMSYEDFFRERQQARYGGGNGRMGRCC